MTVADDRTDLPHRALARILEEDGYGFCLVVPNTRETAARNLLEGLHIGNAAILTA